MSPEDDGGNVAEQAGGAEAVFAWRGQHVAGQLSAEGSTWLLEGCGEACRLWVAPMFVFAVCGVPRLFMLFRHN